MKKRHIVEMVSVELKRLRTRIEEDEGAQREFSARMEQLETDVKRYVTEQLQLMREEFRRALSKRGRR